MLPQKTANDFLQAAFFVIKANRYISEMSNAIVCLLTMAMLTFKKDEEKGT